MVLFVFLVLLILFCDRLLNRFLTLVIYNNKRKLLDNVLFIMYKVILGAGTLGSGSFRIVFLLFSGVGLVNTITFVSIMFFDIYTTV